MYTNSTNGNWNGNRFYFDDLEFWPERGLIRVTDTRNGEFETISVRTALERLQAIVGGAGRSAWPSDRKKMLDFADQMLRCCKIARSQGDPLDPRKLAKDLRDFGRMESVVLPAIRMPKGPQVKFINKPEITY